MDQVDMHSITCFRDAEFTSRSRYVTEDDEQEYMSILDDINNRLFKLIQTLLTKLQSLGDTSKMIDAQLLQSIIVCAQYTL